MRLTTGTEKPGSRIGSLLKRKMLLVCAALLATLPAGAAVRYAGGGFGLRPAFGPWGYGYPQYYGAFPVVSHHGAGQVKLDTKVKSAEVFVNGAFAGTAGELKTMWLRQGSYSIEVRYPGQATFAEKVYVVAGKSIRVRPQLTMEPKS